MPSYLVALPAGMPGLTLANGHDRMVVEAATEADAIAAAQGYYKGPAGDVFSSATAAEITVATDMSPVVNDSGETVPYKLTVTVAGADVNATFEYESVEADTYQGMFTAMAAVINAHASIAGSAASSTTLFTVSSIADDIGDHTVTASLVLGDGPAIVSLLGAITHEGVPGAALTIAHTDAPVLPSYVGLSS